MEKTYSKKWIKKYRNNRVEEEYEVIEDIETQEVIKDGIYRQYNFDGQLSSEREYKDGILNGKSKYYHNGELIKIGRYLNGLREGKWIEHSREKNYVKGELQKKIPLSIGGKLSKELNMNGKLLVIFTVGILLILVIILSFENRSSVNTATQLAEYKQDYEKARAIKEYDLIETSRK